MGMFFPSEQARPSGMAFRCRLALTAAPSREAQHVSAKTSGLPQNKDRDQSNLRFFRAGARIHCLEGRPSPALR
jgi:hypothetical protein